MSQDQRRLPGRPGFTLMELLVVIEIMAIIAAIAFPVFVRARDMARQATCVSNLKQMATATMLYVQDYDERLPSCYMRDTPPFAIDPLTLLQPYLRNWDVLFCPERHTVLSRCRDPRDGLRPGGRCMGYGYNWGSGLAWGDSFAKGDGLVRSPDAAGRAVEGVLLAEVTEPSHCFLYGDTNDYWFVTLLREAMPGVRKGGDPGAPTNGVDQPYEGPRHRGGNQFVFVDGHVTWLPFPGGRWMDGGPWVVPDMSMYSRTGQWEPRPVR